MKKNTEKIVQLSQEKAIHKRNSVISAIARLKHDQLKITFSSVASEANVSRNYLYKTEELKLLIESLRDGKHVIVQKDTKDAIIDVQKKRIKDLENRIRELEYIQEAKEVSAETAKEINDLKEQLKEAGKS